MVLLLYDRDCIWGATTTVGSDHAEWTPNDWADFWRNQKGLNVLPANSREKKTTVTWSQWQQEPVSEEQHEKWIRNNAFSNGIAIMAGRVWHRKDNQDYYLCFIDLDNAKAIEEVCQNVFGVKDINDLAKVTIVEQHLDNRSKAHVYFYTKDVLAKKSSDVTKLKGEIDRNEIPAIEVKCLGEHGIAICSPSVHQDGWNYEIIGTLNLQTFGIEIEDKLNKIYRKYNLIVNKNGKIPIQKLFEDDFVVYEGHNRHEALLRAMESYIVKNKSKKKIEEIKKMAAKWNDKHNYPPLDNIQFEKQWDDAQNFLASNRVSQGYEDINIDKLYKIVEHTPFRRLFYVDKERNEIGYGQLFENQLLPKKSIIDCYHIRIIVYNNPLFRQSESIEIHFNTGLKVGPCYNMNDVIKVLENKGHILNKFKACDALNSIVSAFKDRGQIQYINSVTTSGFYLINGDFISKDCTQTSQIKKEEIVKCCEYLDYLADRGWKNKRIFPTVLKWGIMSPFSFIIKHNTNNWMPWLQMYGHGQTGKTTLGKLILNTWNLNEKNNSLSFNHIDSIARFGNVVGRDTYPRIVNEVGAMSTDSYGKYRNIIEIIKSSVEGITARGRYHDYNNYQESPALSPFILTSNWQPVTDSGYNRRMTSIHFSKEEKKEVQEQEQFNRRYETEKRYLKVLGDFTALYVSKNPQELIEKSWKELSKEILKEFYSFINRQVPDWIEYFEEQKDAVDESTEKSHFGLRAFLINRINEVYARNLKLMSINVNEQASNELSHKLNFCLHNNLISFIRPSSQQQIVITVDIMSELKKIDWKM